MRLTTRLSAFFLAALALVLAGFSLTLYWLAHGYLHRQVEHQLQASLDILAAATEDGPGGMEWEPQERQLTLGREDGPDQVRWTVLTLSGGRVDASRNLGGESWRDGPEEEFVSRQGRPWQVMRRNVTSKGAKLFELPSHKKESEKQQGGEKRYPGLTLVCGLSLEPIQETLRNLALALIGVSASLWLLAAFLGHWLCRRALAPVTQMAAAARAMTAADRDQRLPCPASGDELHDLGQSFNDLLARLQEAYERQQRFTGDASHQLRTPLTAILGQIDVALRRDRSAGDYREVLNLVRGQAVQLRQIVEMLLFLARADGEARLPHLEPVDLAAWLGDYLRHWSDHPRAADLRLECPRGSGVLARVQPALLGQLLDNLLDNAFKYSAAGTPVVLRVAPESGAVSLSVEDAGCGIAPEHLPHVFEPFYRAPVSPGAACPGVGLGLAVAQRIARAFGGTLGVESEVGRGSQFRLRLPAGEGPGSPATPSDRPPSGR
jgi:heavy metal sensor kinase